MEWSQLTFIILLVAALVGLAVYYAWRQVRALRALPLSEEPAEDRDYIRRQAWRRLVGCALMLLFAGLFIGWFALGLDDLASELGKQGEAAAAGGVKPEMNPEQKRTFSFISYYLIAALVVFFLLIITAGLDVLAIRRFGRRHLRQIQEDRRAMIERQAARMRSQRNGHAE